MRASMLRAPSRNRFAALTVKLLGLGVGVVSVSLALAYLFDDATFLVGTGRTQLGDVIAVLASASLAFTGAALIAQLPESFRVRFRRIPTAIQRKPVYGLGTMLAVGIGATLGSPLFILIPENIVQYTIVSLGSLVLAAILSVGMAKVYSDMYVESKALGLGSVGGPSFTKLAAGTKSARYFISRLSMWVANTALAAYTKIVFLVFDFVFMPQILQGYGFSPVLSQLTIYLIAAAFIAWTLLNIAFEQRFLRVIGAAQILLTALLLVILLYHSLLLGNKGSWNLAGLFSLPPGLGWVPALIINTGYLYLLFFGFQEIQSLERDAVERSSVPIVSWIRKGYQLERTTYFGIAMVASVVVASAVNIFYALAVFSVHPSSSALLSSQIPALYLAQNLLGPGQELLIGVAFLIATITTFVPAFLAAARHLAALGEDGYMPHSLAKLSWVFTLVAVFLLAVGNQDFLVNITDFMVLISLGIITFSAIWLKRRASIRASYGTALPVVIGISCFAFGGAVYFLSPSVVVFGSIAVVFAYLIFDILELGSLGVQLFLPVFNLSCLTALEFFQHTTPPAGVLDPVTRLLGVDLGTLLVYAIIVASALLVANLMVDIIVLERTALVRRGHTRSATKGL
ncbi:MAG: APC family permease [Thaumarchaeota archaeon]|nr:APC family permease [Nitrososphaerota archaeon]